MALLIGDNFNYQGQKPNFERDSFDTLESMVSYPETSIDDGHISYCKETKKHYIFNSSNKSTDTGKWREFSTTDGAYVIDYLTAESGTITQEQYNELQQAISDNRNILFVSPNEKINVNRIDINGFGLITLLLSIGDVQYELEIKEDLTYSLGGRAYQFKFSIGFGIDNTGQVDEGIYDNLKNAIINNYSIIIYSGETRESKFCTITRYEPSSEELYLQYDGFGYITQVTITPDNNYTIKNIPNTSGPIKDFNDAPEVVKNVFDDVGWGIKLIDNYAELAEAVGNTVTTYIYNRLISDSNSNYLSNVYITVGPNANGILYTLFSPFEIGTHGQSMYGSLFVNTNGVVDISIRANVINPTENGIFINVADTWTQLENSLTLKTEGTGDQFLADNGQYKTIDASNSSAILPFEKAPQIVQRFVNDYLSDISRESYTIDYADQLFTDTSDINHVTYLYYNNTFGVTYIYFSGNTDSANRIGAVLDMPAYSGYYRLVSSVSTDNSGNVEAYYVAQTSQPSINGLNIVNANSEKSEQIDLYTNGSGTQFLSDDGTYKTITSSDSVIKSFSNAPQVIKNIINKIFEVLANSENTQFPVVIDYYNDLSTAIGNKTLCYIIDNFNDVYSEGYNNMTPIYLYLWNISGQIWINMYISCVYLPNMIMQQYTIVVGVNGITQIHNSGHQIDGMNGGIFISTNFSSVGTDVNQTYEEQLTFAINGDGTKYLGDDGKYHEVKQVSSYGATANRPSNVSIGFQYFDTDLNRPIWWNGTEWVGATDANIVKLTQAQYEELTTKDPDTIYFIKG